MPEINEIQRGNKLGFKDNCPHIWAACSDCGKTRWVRCIPRGNKPESEHCNLCAYKYRAISNTGQRRVDAGKSLITKEGYVFVRIYPEDPYYPMAFRSVASGLAGKYIQEHRLVMAKHLGRYLSKSEIVHHKNGVKTDNRIENLELISRENHDIYNKLCSQCELRKEIRLLRWQVRELAQASQAKLEV